MGPDAASPTNEPNPTPTNDPEPVSEETALAVNEAYYVLIEEMNAMFADPSGSYDWERVAVEPIRSALANEQAERLRFGQIVRWPIDSVYTDVILGTSKADPVDVGGTARSAVRIDTCIVDDAIDTYPAENTQVDRGPVTRWITLIMVNDGGWKVSSLESSNEIEGIAPCGIGETR